jgi:hypothetical protein
VHSISASITSCMNRRRATIHHKHAHPPPWMFPFPASTTSFTSLLHRQSRSPRSPHYRALALPSETLLTQCPRTRRNPRSRRR